MLIEFEGKRPRIGKDVFITPTAVLVGDVKISNGSVVLPFTTLGNRTLVAANRPILEHSEFPPEVLFAGSPARIKGDLTGRALEWTQFAIEDYSKLRARYRAQNIDELDMGR